MTAPLTLLQGTVDLLILQTVTLGAQHGHGVSQLIRQRTDGSLKLEDAALYQSLHRLERQRLVRAEWGLSDNNRRAKFYRLTRSGRRRLQNERANWADFSTAVAKILERA